MSLRPKKIAGLAWTATTQQVAVKPGMTIANGGLLAAWAPRDALPGLVLVLRDTPPEERCAPRSGYSITHAPSGLNIVTAPTLTAAAKIAQELGALPIDWRAPGAAVVQQVTELRETGGPIADTLGALMDTPATAALRWIREQREAAALASKQGQGPGYPLPSGELTAAAAAAAMQEAYRLNPDTLTCSDAAQLMQASTGTTRSAFKVFARYLRGQPRAAVVRCGLREHRGRTSYVVDVETHHADGSRSSATLCAMLQEWRPVEAAEAQALAA